MSESVPAVVPNWLNEQTPELSERGAKCVFCQIVAGEAHAVIVHESETAIAFLDHHPATLGHTLVVPRDHYDNLLDCPPGLATEISSQAIGIARAMVDSVGANGVNIVQATGSAAHQTVNHLHFHVLPRYIGDEVVVFPRLSNLDYSRKIATLIRAAVSSQRIQESK